MPTWKRILFALLWSVAALTATANDHGQFRYQGFASFGYIESSHYNYLVDSNEGDADFTEVGLNFAYFPKERTAIKGQAFAFDLGDYGNYQPQIDYLFVDYSFNPQLGIRAGRVKRVAGLHTETQNIDVARTSIFLPMGLYDARYRDFSAYVDGVSLYGSLLDHNQRKLIDYTLYAGLKRMSPEGGIGGITHSLMSRRFDEVEVSELSSKYNFGGQLWWHTPIEHLRAGLSASYFPNIQIQTDALFSSAAQPAFLAGTPLCNKMETDLFISHLSLEYFTGNWTFAAEYYQQARSSDQVQTVGKLPPQASRFQRKADGWYASISRRIWERLELGSTYTEYFADTDNRSGSGLASPHSAYTKDLQFSLLINLSDSVLFKLESHNIDGVSQLFNQRTQNPIIDERSWQLWAAKTSVTF